MTTRPSLLSLAFVVALLLSACAQPPSSARLEIEPLEALRLVERIVPDLRAESVSIAPVDGRMGYLVEGVAGEDRYRAEVDAEIARAVRITRNDEAFYEWPGIIAVGHRGTVHLAPENTIAAIEKAIEAGADLIEIDIRESKDGRLVIIHDATVDRTTNGSGLVSEMTLAELQELDAGSWFDERFAGQRIPTLDEALEAMAGRAMPDLDFKAGTPATFIDTVKRHGLLGKVTLYCGDWKLLREALDLTPEFQIRPTVPFGVAGLGVLLSEFDPPIVNIDWSEFSERLVRDVHLHGRQAFVNVMGANDTEFGMERAVEAGADYLQTDRLDLLLPMLRERGWHE